MVLNFIWIGFFLIGFAVALARLVQGDLTIFTQVLTGIFDTAKTGFDISLGLVGVMSLWLGLMKVGENAGLMSKRAIISLLASCSRAPWGRSSAASSRRCRAATRRVARWS